MKSERFTLFILLVEIIAISLLHTAKSDRTQASVPQTPAAVAKEQPAQVTYQWNNNFTLIRLK